MMSHLSHFQNKLNSHEQKPKGAKSLVPYFKACSIVYLEKIDFERIVKNKNLLGMLICAQKKTFKSRGHYNENNLEV